MKRKFNCKGFLKDFTYGFMDGATMALSWMITAFNAYGTVYCMKNKQYRSSAKWFAWLAAVSTYQAVRDTWIVSKRLKGDVCICNFIMTNDDEEDEIDEI